MTASYKQQWQTNQYYNNEQLTSTMAILPYIVYAVTSILSLLSIINLKFAFGRKQLTPAEKTIQSNNLENQNNDFKSHFLFWLKRYTIIQLYQLRCSKFKIITLVSTVSMVYTALVFENSFYWAWISGTFGCTAVFIASQIYLEHRNSISIQHNIKWLQFLIYGMFTFLTILLYLLIANFIFNAKINATSALTSFLFAFLIDQFIGRTILFLIIILLSNKSTKLKSLILLYRCQQQHIQISQSVEVKQQKKIMRRISPTKLNKEKLHFINTTDTEQKLYDPKPNCSNSFDVDSMVNFLEMSQKKRIIKCKLAGQFAQTKSQVVTTPQKYEQFKASDNSVELPQKNNCTSDNETKRYDTPLKVSQNEDCLHVSQIEKNVNQYRSKPIPENQNLCEINLQNSQQQRQQTQSIEQPIDIFARVSRKSKDFSSPKEISISNGRGSCSMETSPNKQYEIKRSYKNDSIKIKINQINEEPEPEDEEVRTKPFKIKFESGYSGDFTSLAHSCDQSKASKVSNSIISHKHEDFENSKQLKNIQIHELQELDLNSPNKKLDIVKQKTQFPPKPKKKSIIKRDFKQLNKSTGSPYLQYLPNMLAKQLQNPKTTKLNEELKRGESSKRYSTKKHHDNNQNAYPSTYQDY